jgi:hypothetical protein
MGLAGGAAAAAVGTVASGALSASAAGTAAGGAADAAKLQIKQQQNAVANSNNTFGNVATALQPYTNNGQLAGQGLTNALVNGTYDTNSNLLNQSAGYSGQAAGAYGSAGNAYGFAGQDLSSARNIYGQLQNGPTQAQLEATPGYKFTLQQGLESVQNSAAARGLGSSGAALKGAATYVTGLADQTYQNNFNDMAQVAQGYQNNATGDINQGSGYMNQGQGYNSLANTALSQQAGALSTNQQNYNMLVQPYQTGLQAASAYGQYATDTAGAVNSGLTGIGQAGAAGAVGSANANAQGLSNIGGAVSGLGGSLQQNLLLNKLIGGGSGFGAGGTTYTPTNPTADYSALFPNG